MFSTAVEVVLHIAFREAVSRRHAYLTLEHLLFALAHDPDGERILGACGADLALAAQERQRQPGRVCRRGSSRTGTRAGADDRIPAGAAGGGHARAECAAPGSSGGRPDCGNPPAAADPRRDAAGRTGHHPARRPRISRARHHQDADSQRPELRSVRWAEGFAGSGDPGSGTAKDPLSAYCVNLTARARQGMLDPLIGRADELQRTIEVLSPAPQEQPGVRRRCRRRENCHGRRARRAAAGR